MFLLRTIVLCYCFSYKIFMYICRVKYLENDLGISIKGKTAENEFEISNKQWENSQVIVQNFSELFWKM